MKNLKQLFCKHIWVVETTQLKGYIRTGHIRDMSSRFYTVKYEQLAIMEKCVKCDETRWVDNEREISRERGIHLP